MSRTIEAIMRHMAAPSSRLTDQSNGVEKVEREITVKKRRYIWSESRFVRTMLPFHSNPSRLQWNGSRRQKRNGPDDAGPTGRGKGVDPYRRTRCGSGNARCRSIHTTAL